MSSYDPKFTFTQPNYPKFNANPASLYPGGVLPTGLTWINSDVVPAPDFKAADGIKTLGVDNGTSGLIATFTIKAAGSALTDGGPTEVSVVGGSGSGATANITISSGEVTVATINKKGTGYKKGEDVTLTGLAGVTLTTATMDPIAGATATDVAITGGSGQFATADVTVSGGEVTAAAINQDGSGFVQDELVGLEGGGYAGVVLKITALNG